MSATTYKPIATMITCRENDEDAMVPLAEYLQLERENAALREAGDKLREALSRELKDVQAVAEMFGDPDSPHVKKLTAVIEQWNAARKEAQP